MSPTAASSSGASRQWRQQFDPSLMAIRRMTDGKQVAAAPSTVARHVPELRTITQMWVPLGEARHAAAQGSPADQGRWQQLLAAADLASRPPGSFEELLVAAFGVRDLIRALRDTPPGTPPVHDVAHRIRGLISGGRFTSTLSVSQIADDLAVPAAVVGLALEDLTEAGELCRWRGRPAIPAKARCLRASVPAAGDLKRSTDHPAGPPLPQTDRTPQGELTSELSPAVARNG
jgi:hypothetical protein